MADKMTNVKALSYVLDTFGDELPTEVKTKIEAIKAQTAKKNSSASKADEARAKAKASKGEEILAEMNPTKGYRVKDMLAEFPCLAVDRTTWNSSMVTSILRNLVEAGKLVNEKVKGESYYKLAE